jgi:hypothetical protein
MCRSEANPASSSGYEEVSKALRLSHFKATTIITDGIKVILKALFT